jgi:carboxynorspermidine decarboxylase
LGGTTCLSGDYLDTYTFEKLVQIGDDIIFEDMIHYTMVKTSMFNGVPHPSIGIWTEQNEFQLIRKFGYQDYKRRLS